MSRMTTWVIAIAAALGLATGMAGGYWWATRRAADDAKAATDAVTASPERKVLYWYDPMVPDQRFDRPGKSPFMDMALLPKYADEGTAGGVRIDAGQQQNLGIRTAVVEIGRLTAQLRVPATLTWDLRRETVVSTPVNAIVSQVHVKAPFEPVRRGQPLATVLAPEWSSALAEANALGDAHSKVARELRGAAQQRLRALGVPGGSGHGSGMTLSAPQDGVVSEVLVREGQAVMPGTPLFRVNGTDTLWLEAAIPQAGSVGIGPGTKVEATVSATPGETFDGEVETLLPQIDPASRTQRARIVLRNEGNRLVPGMFAELTLRGGEGAAVPLVPSETLIATGSDSRVIVLDADGRFQPVRVRIGRSSGGRTEVLAGLKGGERVVTSGQFLIDSEASLSGALQRLETPGAAVTQPAATTRPMPTPSAPSRSKVTERKVLYWYDPMVPGQHFDKPGKSPYMDMQLVPKYADEVPEQQETMEGMDADERSRERQP